MTIIFHLLYFVVLWLLVFVSYGFVDANSPFPRFGEIYRLVQFARVYPTAWYVGTLIVLFVYHRYLLGLASEKKVSARFVWKIIFLTVLSLVCAFPAFSNDIFNYIATAKVTFLYKENPYVVMPIDIRNEQMLSFLHASNKVALYGPVWIAMTFIPYRLGFGNLLITLYAFKSLVAGFYLFLLWFLWKHSQQKLTNLIWFALNPLVILQTLVDGHNDVVMMFLALFAFDLLKRRRVLASAFMFVCSILIKGATVALLPVFVWIVWQQARKNDIYWNAVWRWSAVSMFVIFLLSPLREELYPWYFIWPMTFLALVPGPIVVLDGAYVLSLGLSLRIVPFLWTREWGDITPVVKKIVTVVPLFLSGSIYAILKKL